MSKTNFGQIDLEAERVLPLQSSKPGVMSAEKLTSLSSETLLRRYPDRVVDLSPGRKGMKVRHALEISNGKAASLTGA